MKKLFLCSILFLLMMSGMAQAALTTIGTATYNGQDYNLIWDDDNNGNSVVWLDYTNGYTNWNSHVTWADGLDDDLAINLYDDYSLTWDEGDWRLPTSAGTWGYNQTTSEMGHLFYEELGNLGALDANGNGQSGWGLENTGDFENLIAAWYWSGTEYADSTSRAWGFTMQYGTQHDLHKMGTSYGLAVRSGQVSVSSVSSVSSTPIPGTVLLLGAGLFGLAAAGRRKGRGV